MENQKKTIWIAIGAILTMIATWTIWKKRKKRKEAQKRGKKGRKASRMVRMINKKQRAGKTLTYPERMFVYQFSDPDNNPRKKKYRFFEPIFNKPSQGVARRRKRTTKAAA